MAVGGNATSCVQFAKTPSSFQLTSTYAIASYITATTMVVVVGQLLWRRQLGLLQRPPLLFFSTTAVSLALRTAWLIARAGAVYDAWSSLYVQLLNRAALLTLFTAYSAYTLTWKRALTPFQTGAMHKRRRTANVFTDTVAFVTANSVLYVLTVALIAVQASDSHDHAQQLKVYHVDVVTVAVSTLLCALVFVCYGCRLRGRLSSIPDPPPLVKAATSKILLATAWSGLCFSIRCTLFLWSATIRTGEPTPCFINATVDKIAYPWFYYVVPDVVPALAMVVMMIPSAPAKSVSLTKQRSELGLGRMSQSDADFLEQGDGTVALLDDDAHGRR